MSRALVTLYGPADKSRAINWISQAKPGTRVEFKETKRSIPQNDLLWARLTDVARQVIWHGERLTPTDWKDIFTAALRKSRVVPGLEPGSFVVLGLHTSDLSKDEMGNLLDLIDAFGAENGVDFGAKAA